MLNVSRERLYKILATRRFLSAGAVPLAVVLALGLGMPSAAQPAGATSGTTIEAANGAKLFVRKIGKGPVVVVPGGLFLDPALASLAERGRTIVFYDPRGRGRSSAIDPASASLDADIADLEAVRRSVGADRISVIGYSYLGKVAVGYAMRHPQHVDRLVLLGPAPQVEPPAGPPPPALEPLPEVAAKRRCEVIWSNMRQMLAGTPEGIERLGPGWCDMSNERPERLFAHMAAVMPTVRAFRPTAADLAKLDRPTLILHGTADRLAPVEGGRQWAKDIPGAKLIEIEGAGHNSWVDQPTMVVQAIDQFLEAGSARKKAGKTRR